MMLLKILIIITYHKNKTASVAPLQAIPRSTPLTPGETAKENRNTMTAMVRWSELVLIRDLIVGQEWKIRLGRSVKGTGPPLKTVLPLLLLFVAMQVKVDTATPTAIVSTHTATVGDMGLSRNSRHMVPLLIAMNLQITQYTVYLLVLILNMTARTKTGLLAPLLTMDTMLVVLHMVQREVPHMTPRPQLPPTEHPLLPDMTLMMDLPIAMCTIAMCIHESPSLLNQGSLTRDMTE